MPTTRLAAAFSLAIAAATIVLSDGVGLASNWRFLADDPVWIQPDTQDASALARQDVDLAVDVAYNLLTGRARPARRAANVNTVDEVPDSSWFTNRERHAPLDAGRLTRGPNMHPALAGEVWRITASKSDGVTPGFTVTDDAGVRWFLKFDPRGHRGMATGTEVTVTKLMWALGYHVPENHLAYVRAEQLVIGAEATFTAANGRTRPLRTADIATLLAGVDREADGRYRVVASRALDGTPVGRIRFFGTRADDPNDIVPHEDRRELRGYGVFAAWLNHVDAKAINSLDTLVTTPDGRRVVRHHLIDFGSALGSGGVGPADEWAGEEYLFAPRRTAMRMATLGLAVPEWRSAAFYESSSVGRLPADPTRFDPVSWRPRVPNRAFLAARDDDRFWAARRLALMTPAVIASAIRAGAFADAASEAFLQHTLETRRAAILKRYLGAVNPVIDPALSDTTLTFANAAVDAGIAAAPNGYLVRWYRFDNATRASAWIGESRGTTTAVAAPSAVAAIEDGFVLAEVNAEGAPAAWTAPVGAYFRRGIDGWRLVGLDRGFDY